MWLFFNRNYYFYQKPPTPPPPLQSMAVSRYLGISVSPRIIGWGWPLAPSSSPLIDGVRYLGISVSLARAPARAR